MISIIICSKNATLLDHLCKNIQETIGMEHEIIATDNSVHCEGICKVYNEAGKKARFPVLCFVHEDVSFATANWGHMVIAHLQKTTTGLIGIAGGDTKSIVPSSWYVSSKSNQINVFQHYRHKNMKPVHIRISDGENHTTSKRVAALDGVFLCTRKEVFNEFKFDEVNLKGFHGYDIDYSIQVSLKYELYAVFDILIHHYSEGKPGKDWMESAIQISKKWKKQLPYSVYNLSKNEFSLHHWKTMQIFIDRLMKLNYNYYRVVLYFLSYSFTRFFSARRFISMSKYLLGYMYQKSTSKHPSNSEKHIMTV